MSCTATVVFPDSCAPTTRRTAGGFLRRVEKAAFARRARSARGRLRKSRSSGSRLAPSIDELPVRRRSGQEVDGRDVVAVLVRSPSASEIGPDRGRGGPSAGGGTSRTGRNAPRSVTWACTPPQSLSRVLLERRPEDVRAEDDARQPERVRRVGRLVRVEPRRADELERPRRAAPFGEVRPLDEAAAGIDERGLGASACSGTAAPTRASRRVSRRVGARPAFAHRDDREVAAERRTPRSRNARSRPASSRAGPATGTGRRRRAASPRAGCLRRSRRRAGSAGRGRRRESRARRRPSS